MADEPYDNGFRFNKPIREKPAAAKGRLFEYHKRAGSLGDYYDQFPLSRPKKKRLEKKFQRMGREPERQPEMGRGRR